MSAAQLTERQQEIKGLMESQPEITATEIAKILETTAGSVYQSQSRMRKIGALPKAKKRRRRAATAAAIIAAGRTSPPAPPPPPSNGAISHDVEDLLAEEVARANERYEEIEKTQAELEAERGQVGEHRRRLVAAQEAMTNAVK